VLRDNSEVEEPGEHVGSLTDADREPYLRAALLAFESGSLDAHEYTQRVRAIDRANSVAEMAEVLGQRSSKQSVSGAEDQGAKSGLDPVDLARLMAPAPGVRSRAKSARYTVLIMVGLLLVVLLGIGLWLAARIHNENANSGGAVARPAVALQVSPPGPPPGPPSVLSPRR
jgi:hypothetical protein